MTVFQRSAPYVVPKPDRGYSRPTSGPSRRSRSPRPSDASLTALHSEQLNRTLAEQGRMTSLLETAFRLHLRHQVSDAGLRAELEPDYPIGCKRLLFSNDWYPALVRDNVDVVTTVVSGVDADGVATDDGAHHGADVIVWGTGFRATEFLAPVEVVGREGRPLADEWRDGAHAHLGITRARLPQRLHRLRPQHQPRRQLHHLDDRVPDRLPRPGGGGAAGRPRRRRRGAARRRRRATTPRCRTGSRAACGRRLLQLVPVPRRPGHHQLARAGAGVPRTHRRPRPRRLRVERRADGYRPGTR